MLNVAVTTGMSYRKSGNAFSGYEFEDCAELAGISAFVEEPDGDDTERR